MHVIMILAAVMLLLATIAVCVGLVYRKRTETRLMANANNQPGAGVHGAGLKTYLADAAITRFHVVKIGSDGDHVAVSAGATDISYGVAQDAATAAEDHITIAMIPGGGATKVIAAAAISNGALVQSNGDGKVKTAVSTGYVIGRALQAALGDGDEIEIQILFTGVALT